MMLCEAKSLKNHIEFSDLNNSNQLVFEFANDEISIEYVQEVIDFYKRYLIDEDVEKSKHLLKQDKARYLNIGTGERPRLIDLGGLNFKNYCEEKVRCSFASKFFGQFLNYYNKLLSKLSIDRVAIDSLRFFNENYLANKTKEQKELFLKICHTFVPSLFLYNGFRTLTTLQTAIVKDEFNDQQLNIPDIKKQAFSKKLLNIDQKIVDSNRASNYWLKQHDLFNQLCHIYYEKLKDVDEKESYEFLNKTYLRFESCYQFLHSQKTTSNDNVIIDIGIELQPQVESKKANPISKYDDRVERWLKNYSNPIKAVKSFVDQGKHPYLRQGKQNIIDAIQKHRFSLKVDDLLTENYGEYAYKTDRGYAMVAELTDEVGRKQLGAINYAVDDKGVCYHRMFHKQEVQALVGGDLSELLNSLQVDDLPNDGQSNSVMDQSDEDTLSINSKTGIATIHDKKNKTIIRVMKRPRLD